MSKLINFVEFLNGFRKLTIIVAVILITTVLLLFGFIDAETYGKILTASVPAYMAGNVGEWAVKEIGTWAKTIKKG
jgi:hypothetical protein